jgi:hypothetical protein
MPSEIELQATTKRAMAVLATSIAIFCLSAVVSLQLGSGAPLGLGTALATNAPACVHTNSSNAKPDFALVVVYNRCAYSYSGSYIRAKAVFSFGADTRCTNLIRNHRYEFLSTGWFDHMQLC